MAGMGLLAAPWGAPSTAPPAAGPAPPASPPSCGRPGECAVPRRGATEHSDISTEADEDNEGYEEAPQEEAHWLGRSVPAFPEVALDEAAGQWRTGAATSSIPPAFEGAVKEYQKRNEDYLQAQTGKPDVDVGAPPVSANAVKHHQKRHEDYFQAQTGKPDVDSGTPPVSAHAVKHHQKKNEDYLQAQTGKPDVDSGSPPVSADAVKHHQKRHEDYFQAQTGKPDVDAGTPPESGDAVKHQKKKKHHQKKNDNYLQAQTGKSDVDSGTLLAAGIPAGDIAQAVKFASAAAGLQEDIARLEASPQEVEADLNTAAMAGVRLQTDCPVLAAKARELASASVALQKQLQEKKSAAWRGDVRPDRVDE